MVSLKVLVTGASGFVASWIVKEAISRGYFVRGTVRNAGKGEYLKKSFGDKFEYVIVEDIEKKGAFDEAVKDIDVVLHTASPFRYNIDDPQELIRPAVGGTKNILQSILKNGNKVRRVVITSSNAAVTPLFQQGDPQKKYDESAWNNIDVEITEKEGSKALPGQKYYASKTLAEKAAWEFVDQHKNETKWDLVTLHPTFVFGPIIHEVPNAASLNTSSASFLSFLKNEPPKSAADLTASLGSYVDVRDVAWAHVEAITADKLASKDAQAAFKEGKGRINLAAGPFTWQDVVDELTDAHISLPEVTPQGEKGAGQKTVHPALVNCDRAQQELGLKFRNLAEMFGDTLRDYREKGWI